MHSSSLDTEEMRIGHFKQGLKGSVKKMVAGHAYANFQEMYYRHVKIDRVMDETKAESREIGYVERKFGHCVSSP